jgi:hypothetical protein
VLDEPEEETEVEEEAVCMEEALTTMKPAGAGT